MFKIQNYIK